MFTVKDAIDSLIDSVPNDTQRRFNCPVCKGINTFSISKLDSEIKYNCFKASCDSKLSRGIKKLKADMDTLKTRLEGSTEVNRVFSIPEYWIMGIASETMLRMLIKTNCLEAYSKGLFKCAYDPQEDRLVFLLLNDNKQIVGGVGRTLSNKKPKTKNYFNSTLMPFIVGEGNRLVLVEDCASACAVTSVKDFVGLALLGTNLKEEYIPYIVKYDTVYIALDYDARKKAIDLKTKLSYYCKNIRIVILAKDLKDMTKEEINNCLH